MNHKLSPGLLLDDKGNLNEAGYATTLIKEYDRDLILASKWRIKEWDYYYVGDENYGIAMTIDDNGYMGLCSCSILGFNEPIIIQNKANMFWFPFGKVNMPKTSVEGSVQRCKKHYQCRFINEDGIRHLYYSDDNVGGKKFECKVQLLTTSPNSLVIATPFNKNKHFYYNQKINNLKVKGYFKWGDMEYVFSDKAYGVLDWGRGVWTYKNTWYWSSMSGQYHGKTIGFNLGYGFGDTKNASENMLFVDSEAFKLDDVVFDILKDEKGHEKFLQPWKIYSKSRDIDLLFTPILDRHDCTNALILSQDAHQVFGKFSGKFIIKDQVIEIENMIGFAEKVKNKW